MPRCRLPLHPPKAFVERRNRQFKHHDLAVSPPEPGKKVVQPGLEVGHARSAENIIPADLDDDNRRIDGRLLQPLRRRGGGFADMGEILHLETVSGSEDRRPFLAGVCRAMASREGVADDRHQPRRAWPQHWHDMISGFIEPNRDQRQSTRRREERCALSRQLREERHGDRQTNQAVCPVRQRRRRDDKGDEPQEEGPRSDPSETEGSTGPHENGTEQEGNRSEERPTARDLEDHPMHGGSRIQRIAGDHSRGNRTGRLISGGPSVPVTGNSEAVSPSPIPRKTPALPEKHQATSTPGRDRTCDLSFRKAPLYPTELREQNAGRGLAASPCLPSSYGPPPPPTRTAAEGPNGSKVVDRMPDVGCRQRERDTG